MWNAKQDSGQSEGSTEELSSSGQGVEEETHTSAILEVGTLQWQATETDAKLKSEQRLSAAGKAGVSGSEGTGPGPAVASATQGHQESLAGGLSSAWWSNASCYLLADQMASRARLHSV